MDREQMFDVIDKLQSYLGLASDEWEWTLRNMIELWQHGLINDAFKEALEKEIVAWLVDVEQNARIETHTRVIPERTEVIRELIWD